MGNVGVQKGYGIMVTTVVCTTPPHPTPHCWPQTGAHTANTGLLVRAVSRDWWKQYWSITFYYPIHPGRSLEAAQRQLKGTQVTIQTSNTSYPTCKEDYILQEWKTTSYTDGRPRPTWMEDHVLHRWRTATEKLILLKLITLNGSCVVFSLYGCSVQGLGHTNASVYAGVCSLLQLWRFIL